MTSGSLFVPPRHSLLTQSPPVRDTGSYREHTNPFSPSKPSQPPSTTTRLRFHQVLLGPEDPQDGNTFGEENSYPTCIIEQRSFVLYHFHYPTAKTVVQSFLTLKVEPNEPDYFLETRHST